MSRTAAKTTKHKKHARHARGFVQAGGLLQNNIRVAGEKRGFAQTRLLIQWAEIVGAATAALAEPVKVSYGRQGLGATLTLLCTGSNAPIVQAELPRIQDRVNACYGYAAISRIVVTQTTATGFAQAPTEFAAQQDSGAAAPTDDQKDALRRSLDPLENKDLQAALETLGHNILTRQKS